MKEINMSPYTHENGHRIDLVRAGIIGASFHLPHEETLMFPFLDYLHLLFQPTPEQDPIAFLIWQGKKCIHSTFTDLYYAHKYHLLPQSNKLVPPQEGVPISKDENLWLTIHRVCSNALRELEKKYPTFEPIPFKNETQQKLLPPDYGSMRQANMVLNGNSESDNSNWLGLTNKDRKDFDDLLIKSLLCKRQDYPIKSVHKSVSNFDYKTELLPHLDSFRDVLDDVFCDSSKMLHLEEKESHLGNIYCVIKTIQSNTLRLNAFPFSAGLLLSKQQQKSLKHWAANGCVKREGLCPISLGLDKNCLNDLEIPLGQKSRSVADIVFCSGTIEFARNAGDEIWDRIDKNNSQEQNRLKIEKCIYPDENSSLYYVPIHMQGIPWLSIFTFSSNTNSNKRWLHNYFFYHDIVQRIAPIIRVNAPEEYIKRMSDIAANELLSWEKTPTQINNHINKLWEQLAHVYPMPFFSINQTDDLSNKKFELNIPGHIRRNLIVSDNPFFGVHQVNWRRLNPNDIVEKLTKSIYAFIFEKSKITVQEHTRSFSHSAHALETKMSAFEYDLNKCEDEKIKGTLLDHHKELNRASQISMAVFSKERRNKIKDSFVKCNIDEFKEIINSITEKCFSNFSRDKIVPENFSLENIIVKFNDKEDCYLIEYNYDYLDAVFDEAIKNSFKRMHDNYKELIIEINFSDSVFLTIKNPTRSTITFSMLEQTTTNLNIGSPDKIGINTIKLWCEVCEYKNPKWKAIKDNDYNYMKFLVQIANIG